MPSFTGGALKLKGLKVKSNTKKKKKKTENGESGESTEKNEIKLVATSTDTIDVSDDDDELTETQKKHKKILQMKLKKEVSESTDLDYRNRLEKFNLKLATETEHNDIPRVSAAGNG